MDAREVDGGLGGITACGDGKSKRPCHISNILATLVIPLSY